MSKTLSGKVALVTGGSRGVGAGTARRLAEAGADVAVSYVNSAAKAEAVVEDLRGFGVRAAAFRADQASVAEAVALVDHVAAHFGRLDILVNNAAIAQVGLMDDPDRDEEEFARMLAINVTSVVAATRQAVLHHLGEGSRIILVSSGAADRVPYPGMSDYSASKAALEAYGRGWARDLGPRGITVNSVVLGAIDTDMVFLDEAGREQVVANTPIGRFGRPADVAGAIAFLAGPESAFVTGSRLVIDGGLQI
jgi:3-oxoacyl-[acyl-carrier protein] reductase